MSRRKPTRPRVLILGGGFAGLAASLALRPDRYDVTLVDRARHFEFLPNIHELLSGVKTPELLRLPLDRNVRRSGHRFVRDTVTAIETQERAVQLERRAPLSYDALIVALGGVDNTRGVPGVEEHAIGFKSVDACHRIGRRLAKLAKRREPARVVIVGGGLEGVEALGEILRRHRRSGLELTLVEAGERLLVEAPASLDPHVRKLCAPFEVAFEMEARVARISAKRVKLEDGRRLASDLTIWTGGPAPPALLADSGLAPRGEWAPVNDTLESKDHPGVFVAGDAADLPTALSKQAYHAIDMGACAAQNAVLRLGGHTPERFRPSGKPMLISFGDLSCFLVAGERALAGPVLGAAKELIFEAVMLQLDSAPVTDRLPRLVQRVEQATRQLAWPTLVSPRRLLRQAQIELL